MRLKGGDPFVFGRGGEEALALMQAGIPFEVVPGVTSAVAAPASAGIPVTHRGIASSFAVVTGHEEPTKHDSAIQWERLAGGVDTLVFLMGVERVGDIADSLLRAGRRADEPAAVIRWGTTADQLVVSGALGRIAQQAKEAGIRPPAVLVVGQVVNLRAALDWRSQQPLAGLRVLVTRARQQASQLSARLRDLGAVPIEYPTIEIQPLDDPTALDDALARIGEFGWVILTSVNGVDAVFARLSASRRDARAFAKARVCAIGPATGAALARNGIRADLVPAQFVSDAILAELSRQDLDGVEVLLARADIAPPGLADGLRDLGARVTDVSAYRTVPSRASHEQLVRVLEAREIDVVTLTSSSTARNLVDGLDGRHDLLDGVPIACIGPVTGRTARELGLRIDVEAREHTVEGLVAAILAWRSRTRQEVAR